MLFEKLEARKKVSGRFFDSGNDFDSDKSRRSCCLGELSNRHVMENTPYLYNSIPSCYLGGGHEFQSIET